MDHDETGCQAPPDRPILCINNCGFFGSAATMNLCSKCHKDLLMKSEQAKVATSSAAHIVKVPIAGPVDVQVNPVEPKSISVQLPCDPSPEERVEAKPKEGPNRCDTCKKRVGLTGFKCRCGHLYCATHRYSDKHDCQFDYHGAAREAIEKANPVVKAEKLDKM